MKRLRLFLPLLFLFLFLSLAHAQDLASFEKRVTVKKLSNGLTVLVLRRPEAPVFSFRTIVDAGDAQDPLGKTGLAHMMEHMAFKGSTVIGTTNYPKEKLALEKVEQAYREYDRERQKTVGQDKAKLAQLEKAWLDARAEADQYAIKNEFGEIVERSGGVGLNASTGEDVTQYEYSMPANRIELWAYLESERFLHPVMREFYRERDVVMEERRMRVDSSPIGRAVAQFLSVAFDASPYHRPGIGYMQDLQHFSATDAMEFFKRYYVPSNMVVAVVGDVDPAQVFAIVERYFGRLPAAPKPEEYSPVETRQNSERSVVLKDPSQPVYLEGYRRPNYLSPDDAVYDVISDLMSEGRTSRLYRTLVRDRKIAIQAGGFSGFPGFKYENLFAFYGVPTSGHTNKEVQDAIREEIEKLRTTDVSDEELKMVKTRARAALIRGLADNNGLASELAEMQLHYGDWRELFRQIDRIDKVTKEDIRRVANATFVENNRTVCMMETATKGAK